MNELILIDMLSELNPVILQENYIEKDMKKEKILFIKKIFSIMNNSKEINKFPDQVQQKSVIEKKSYFGPLEDLERTEEPKQPDLLKEEGTNDPDEIKWEFNISIFESKFRNLVKIISGIVATIILILGILIIIVKRNRNSIKFNTKKYKSFIKLLPQ